MDLALSSVDGDIVIKDGDLVLLDGIDAIAQDVQTRLRFFRGEWFLDRRVGVPYFEQILVKNPPIAVVRFVLKAAILSTPGIKSLAAFSTEFDGKTRTLSVSFSADTVEGPLVFDRELTIP